MILKCHDTTVVFFTLLLELYVWRQSISNYVFSIHVQHLSYKKTLSWSSPKISWYL
jgi:hypothetical protein